MSATMIAANSLKERLTDILGALAPGLRPPDPCPDGCRTGARCEAYTAALIAVRTVNLAVFAVQDAGTDDIARMAYIRCLVLDLPGITPQQAIDALVAIRLERRLEVIEAGAAR